VCFTAALLQSYSPYSHTPSGVALVLHDGQVVAGSYVENAAHNPGLAPFQAAVVAAVRAGIPDYTKVRQARELLLCIYSRGLVNIHMVLVLQVSASEADHRSI
jgi:cytidine deaminase